MTEHAPSAMSPLTAVIIVLFIGALLIHSYIAVTLLVQWLHKKTVTSIDKIVISLGISRVFLQMFSLLDLLFTIYQHSYQDPGNIMHDVIDNLFILFTYCGIWLSTLFTVAFCLKIAPFNPGIFSSLKGIVLRKTVPLIVLSLVVSVSYTLMQQFFVASKSGAQNVTNVFDTSKIRANLTLFLLGNIVPTGIYCSSSALLIYSLCLHINKMRTNNTSVHVSMDAYYMTINSMAFCLVCYIFTIISNLVVLFNEFILQVLWVHVILNVFPTIHSIFLIYKTRSLRQHVTVLYDGLVHCMSLGGGSGSGVMAAVS
ncbi:taste receptor type 2 member 39-like [Dendropsophus ebraccatus]|uniref:taste receptor type 2 member 39-like n=1 Tax=Dendropsophus ebraccatus TaxID=150705 RepID=UPI0038312E0D